MIDGEGRVEPELDVAVVELAANRDAETCVDEIPIVELSRGRRGC